MGNFDIQFLAERLQEAAFDPTEYRARSTTSVVALGGAGAVLFSLSSRLPGPLSSPDLEEMTADYIKGGWYERDDRYGGAGDYAQRRRGRSGACG